MTEIMTLQQPQGWNLYRLGQVFRERKQKGSDKVFPPLSVTMKGIVPQLENAAKSDDGDNRKIVHIGDYVINSRSDRKGSGGVSEYEGSVSLISIVLEPFNIDRRFAHHLLRSTAFQEEFYRWGHGIVADLWTTRYDDMRNIRLFLPDLVTQRQIADFLDRETARIDLLIEKKKLLRSKLQEKQKNLLNEILTGNYASNKVEMKSTGLFWAPFIPKHWTIQPLKNLIWYQEGPGIMAEDFLDEGVPLLRIRNLSGKQVNLDGCNFLDPKKVKKKWDHFRVENGDYLISGSATTGGVACEVTPDAVGAIPYTGIIRIKPKANGFIKSIIPFFLLSRMFEEQVSILSTGSTIQHFGPFHLAKMKAPMPPKTQQHEIAKVLSDVVDHSSLVLEKIVSSIERLSEYRSSLITAAVTGQINIADWVKAGNTDRKLDAYQAEASA